MIIHDHGRVVVSRTAHLQGTPGMISYSVRERYGKRRVMGYVTSYLTLFDGWAYQLEGTTVWILAGTSKREAVDHLLSAWHERRQGR